MPWDTESTKQALLSAAVQEFATHGPAGARVDRIARRAGVNKERLYTYFGNKQQLFDTVLQRELTDLAVAVPLQVDGEEADALDLGQYAGRVFDYHRQHPHLLRLLHWEGLDDPLGPDRSSGSATRARLQRQDVYRAKVQVLARAQRAGRVSERLDAGVLLYAVVALAAWWLAVPQVARMMLGPLADDTAAQRAALVSMVDRLAR